MTFSRLTLGEPRLKSKLRGGSVSNEPPCQQDVVTGADLLNGRGDMETYVSTTGKTEIAVTINTAARGELTWEDGSVAEAFESGERKALPVYMTGGTTQPEIGDWHISTVNPDTGTYHLRITGHNPTSFGSGNTQRLLFAAGMVCPDIYSFDDWHVDRYPAGAIVTFQFRARTSIPSTAKLNWAINTVPNGVVLGETSFQTITTSYTTYSVSGIVDPALEPQHVYPRIIADFENNTSTDAHIDIDNVIYGIE